VPERREPTRPELTSLTLGDPPAAWRALGFAPSEGGIALGGVQVRLDGPEAGICGWSLAGLPEQAPGIDGLPAPAAGDPPAPASGDPTAAVETHPNGALGIDHVVVLTPDFDRTSGALGRTGIGLSRVAERQDGTRMGFRRLGPVILELVEAPALGSGPARFWGLVVTVEDLDALAASLGTALGAVKDAVQPGRRIATLRPSAGLGEAVAFIDRES
jgi:hypothetical protein